MTIEEMQKEKEGVEKEISFLITKFTSITGLKVDEVNIRKVYKCGNKAPLSYDTIIEIKL